MNNVLPNQEPRLANNKPAIQAQDIFLTMLRKDQIPVMIFLVTGIKLIGRIRAFDKYAVLLENDTHNNNQEQLIYKHAIATVTFRRGGFRSEGHYRSTTDNDDHSSASSLPLPG